MEKSWLLKQTSGIVDIKDWICGDRDRVASKTEQVVLTIGFEEPGKHRWRYGDYGRDKPAQQTAAHIDQNLEHIQFQAEYSERPS